MGKKLVSVVIPAYNEAENVGPFFSGLTANFPNDYEYEIIFVNDGSSDDTLEKVRQLHLQDRRVKLISFSRNFGKELATTAGIRQASGDAILTIDADGQHPMELIPEFLRSWEAGNEVVVGIRKSNEKEGFVKKYGSIVFYKLFNRLSGIKLTPGSTDFRVIDKAVQEIFKEMNETNRITRGLIDWIGFKRAYINFNAKPRLHGEAAYDTGKLIKLAMNSFVSLSFTPLYLFGYVGIVIVILSLVLGIFILIEEYILNDPLRLNITGSGALATLILFLVGIVLISQWLTSLYISRMYEETKRRPLYIVDKGRSIL